MLSIGMYGCARAAGEYLVCVSDRSFARDKKTMLQLGAGSDRLALVALLRAVGDFFSDLSLLSLIYVIQCFCQDTAGEKFAITQTACICRKYDDSAVTKIWEICLH